MAPDPKREAVWRIINVAAAGGYEPIAAAWIAHRFARGFFDDIGIPCWYGTPLEDYGDARMNQYYHCFPDVCWELTKIEKIANDRLRYTLVRTPDRKHEDELFEGPRARGVVLS